MKNGRQTTIPTEPADVYRTLETMMHNCGAGNAREHAALAFALGAMEAAFPLTVGVLRDEHRAEVIKSVMEG